MYFVGCSALRKCYCMVRLGLRRGKMIDYCIMCFICSVVTEFSRTVMMSLHGVYIPLKWLSTPAKHTSEKPPCVSHTVRSQSKHT